MTSPTAAALLIAAYFAALILLWAWTFLAPVERVEGHQFNHGELPHA